MRASGALALLALLASPTLRAENGILIYQALKRFELSGITVPADNLVLQRDRVKMTFTGVFYLETPVAGRVRGAVFLGNGTFAAAPPEEFERENLRRLLKADSVESDFHNAVLRFSDDTDAELGASTTVTTVAAEARALAERFTPRLLRQTGANVASRVALSVLNGEKPAFFCATFDKGRHGRFTYVLDRQGRLPTSLFGLNAGEAGLIFARGKGIEYRRGRLNYGQTSDPGFVGSGREFCDPTTGNDVWMAFQALDDYAGHRAQYSDSFDLVAVRHYDMDIDVRSASKRNLALRADMDTESLGSGIQAVPFLMNSGRSGIRSGRSNCSLRVQSVTWGETAVPFSQEHWESGFTVFLPAALTTGQRFILTAKVAGKALIGADRFYYPLVNTSWYPRHGPLARSTFQLTFHGTPRAVVAGPGTLITESQRAGERITRYSLGFPVPYVTFAGGQAGHSEWRSASGVIIRGYSGYTRSSDFVEAELANSLDYFSHLLGCYPYQILSAVYEPRPFSGATPGLLIMGPTVTSFSDIARETARQWWGHMVGWRSYRDEWLIQGFAEYSAVLYTAAHNNPHPDKHPIQGMRSALQSPPDSDLGYRAGKVATVGPIALGRRLDSRETRNAYQDLVYEKGALVVRMLHFLLSDPESGDDTPFFRMLSEFVERNAGHAVTTENFRDLASTYFAHSPIGRQCALTDLNWFFQQWVFEAHFPSYHMEYRMDDQPGGGVILRGTLTQKNAGNQWFMPLPVVMRLNKHKFARALIYAKGEKNDFALTLPVRPSSVKLDPDLWILSDSTTASASR